MRLTGDVEYPPDPGAREATLPPGWVAMGFSDVGQMVEIQHAFHLSLEVPPAEACEWDEKSGGDIVEHRFAFRWVSINTAGSLLWSAQAMWVNALRLSLLNR